MLLLSTEHPANFITELSKIFKIFLLPSPSLSSIFPATKHGSTEQYTYISIYNEFKIQRWKTKIEKYL